MIDKRIMMIPDFQSEIGFLKGGGGWKNAGGFDTKLLSNKSPIDCLNLFIFVTNKFRE